MPQSLSKVLVHLIFSTKHREPTIPEAIRPRLYAYMVGILDILKSPSLQTGGTRDHTHILFALGRTISAGIEGLPRNVAEAELSLFQGAKVFVWPSSQGGCPGLTSRSAFGAIDHCLERCMVDYIFPGRITQEKCPA